MIKVLDDLKLCLGGAVFGWALVNIFTGLKPSDSAATHAMYIGAIAAMLMVRWEERKQKRG